jgi:hypothetical protein
MKERAFTPIFKNRSDRCSEIATAGQASNSQGISGARKLPQSEAEEGALISKGATGAVQELLLPPHSS